MLIISLNVQSDSNGCERCKIDLAEAFIKSALQHDLKQNAMKHYGSIGKFPGLHLTYDEFWT